MLLIHWSLEFCANWRDRSIRGLFLRHTHIHTHTHAQRMPYKITNESVYTILFATGKSEFMKIKSLKFSVLCVVLENYYAGSFHLDPLPAARRTFHSVDLLFGCPKAFVTCCNTLTCGPLAMHYTQRPHFLLACHSDRCRITRSAPDRTIPQQFAWAPPGGSGSKQSVSDVR